MAEQVEDRNPCSRGGRIPVVLCVDDDLAVLSALRRSLGGESYEVATAQSAAQALACLRNRPVKVVISDEQMPGVSGSEFIAEVRVRWPSIGRVILTGYPGPSLIGRGFRVGVDVLFQKPWDDRELKNTVGWLIREVEPRRAQSGSSGFEEAHFELPPAEGTPANLLHERHVVVLVDDEPRVLAALERSLRKEPYFLLATGQPQKAIRWVEQIDVSAVVSDQRMPEMTGTDLLRRVSSRSPVTVRIILTAFPGATAHVPRLGHSIDCVIAKPWDDGMLRRTLREFLQEREVRSSGRQGEASR